MRFVVLCVVWLHVIVNLFVFVFSCVAAQHRKNHVLHTMRAHKFELSAQVRFDVCVQWRWTDSDAPCFVCAVVPFVWEYYRKLSVFFVWAKENVCFVFGESRSTGVVFQLHSLFNAQFYAGQRNFNSHSYWNVSVCRYKVRISIQTYQFCRQIHSQHCSFLCSSMIILLFESIFDFVW